MPSPEGYTPKQSEIDAAEEMLDETSFGNNSELPSGNSIQRELTESREESLDQGRLEANDKFDGAIYNILSARADKVFNKKPIGINEVRAALEKNGVIATFDETAASLTRLKDQGKIQQAGGMYPSYYI